MHAHDEEEAGEHGLRDQVQHDEEGPAHGAEGQEALREIGDALFYDVRDACGDMALGGAVFVGVCHDFCHAERVGMEGRLGDEPVGERDAEKAGDAGG